MSRFKPAEFFMDRLRSQIAEDESTMSEDEVLKLTTAQRRFLEAYKGTGIITTAARKANTDRKNHYNWCKKSAAYRTAFIEAELEARDNILEMCRKVAVDERNVPMLIHLSKGLFPEMFGTQRHEVSGPGGDAINVKSASSIQQIFGRIDDIVRKRQETLDSQPEQPRLLEGSQDGMEHSQD